MKLLVSLPCPCSNGGWNVLSEVWLSWSVCSNVLSEVWLSVQYSRVRCINWVIYWRIRRPWWRPWWNSLSLATKVFYQILLCCNKALHLGVHVTYCTLSVCPSVCLCFKGTLRRRLTYIFSRSIKSLIYHIFTYKVWTLNFYRKGSEIWSFILTLGNSKLCW